MAVPCGSVVLVLIFHNVNKGENSPKLCAQLQFMCLLSREARQPVLGGAEAKPEDGAQQIPVGGASDRRQR